MINFFANTRRKKDFLYRAIENELKNNDIPFSLFDDKLQWNIFFRENKKYWLILRLGETSGVEYPVLQEYNGRHIWDSETSTLKELTDIVTILGKEANEFYINREQEYRNAIVQEQEWEDFGPYDSRSDEEREFDSLMDDDRAWGNID